MKKIQNKYGFFDETAGEYVITRPDTPTPWMNYLGEGRYGGIISNTAGGYAFDRDPRNRRVSRYRYNSIPMDQPGRYVYLRDQDSGAYWSPTWQPKVSIQLDEYECRHGAGYTKITSLYQGIHADLLYFVPKDESCEIWRLKIRNNGQQARRLRTFSYVEFSFWDANIDMHNLDWGAYILRSSFEDGIICTFTQFRPTTTFHTSNTTPIGYDTDRDEFIGRYHDLANPVTVENGVPDNSLASKGNNIGSLSHDVNLDPGQECEIIYILGVTDDRASIAQIRQKYLTGQQIDEAFASLKEDWVDFLETMQVTTPDPEMNAMLNFWNPVQCRATLYWSRFVSAYETGMGRGMGTRDSAQDTLATVQSNPQRARETLDMLWHLQFSEGYTWHQVFPLSGEGGFGHATEYPDWPQWFSDDHLWLIHAELAYLRETGDYDSLHKPIEFWDGAEATVWEHILRGVDFTYNHRGPHGLPRSGFSDWDDTMNIDHGSGKAESVMVAMQFCRTMLDLTDFCSFREQIEEADRFRGYYQGMKGAVLKHGWAGEWFLRAYDDDGLPLGVPTDRYQQIALNTQSWAILGEIDLGEKGRTAMESAHRRLNTPVGLAIMTPAYAESEARVRGTSTYPPGSKENGGIFCHANTWAVVAAAMLDWGDRAYQYYRQYLPLAQQDLDRYMVEPYVYCGNLCGPEHPLFGRGRNAWLSGTASWSYIAATQWILGIQPTYRGLLIQPVIPSDWKGFEARRIFRGTLYEIVVRRSTGIETPGVTADGCQVNGNIVLLPMQKGGTVKVTAII
jgi:cellobiose phosphorylase